MDTFADLIGRQITPEVFVRRDPDVEMLSFPIHSNSAKRHFTYQDEVFNYLLEKQASHGIKTVIRFRNLRVDGEIVLADEKATRLAIEIKLRMNWEKACQAEWEFRQFLKSSEAQANPVLGGIVFFEEFSADWSRQVNCRQLENGWNHWYLGHNQVDGLRLDLVRLRQGKLDSFPIC